MRWQGIKGGRVMRWQGGKGGRLMRWPGGRVVKREDGKYLVLFKGGGRRESPRFHLFVSDFNQGSKGAGWVQDFLAWLQAWKDSS